MKKPLHPVSDHAVLRYLERVEGIDVEAVRRRIGATVQPGIEAGAKHVIHGGYRYVLSDTVVVTVMRQNNPDPGRVKRRGPKPRD